MLAAISADPMSFKVIAFLIMELFYFLITAA